jgi:hypothetical protein
MDLAETPAAVAGAPATPAVPGATAVPGVSAAHLARRLVAEPYPRAAG